MLTEEVLALAQEFVTEGNNELALYTIRDLPIVEEAGLGDLVWSYFSAGSCGYVPVNEIEYILEKLGAYTL